MQELRWQQDVCIPRIAKTLLSLPTVCKSTTTQDAKRVKRMGIQGKEQAHQVVHHYSPCLLLTHFNQQVLQVQRVS